jgi:SAM-dependent methyltransferase
MAFRRIVRTTRRRFSRRFASWELDPLGVSRRRYRSYDAYLRHQKAKLRERPETVERFDREIAAVLPQRIADLELDRCRVVCVAARRGGEVRAFRSLGAFAWGIDIAPGSENPYVTFGDMHNLGGFPANCADIVYTNSLDHSFDLARVVKSILRILNPGGLLIVGLLNQNRAGDFESRRWTSADKIILDLTTPISVDGGADEDYEAKFRVVSRQTFNQQWDGVHVRFEKSLSKCILASTYSRTSPI